MTDWPAELDAHEARYVEDFTETADPAPRYSIERTLALPEFWDGCARARAECARDHDQFAGLRDAHALRSYKMIADALRAGTPLAKIPEFAEWLQHRTILSSLGER